MKHSIAMGRVKLAIDRMASEYPLHAGVLSQWQLEEDASLSTMGVGFKDGRLRLVFNPEFVGKITLDELMGVVHHEANHVLFDHVLHKPGPGENRLARTIAEEVTVNEWVPEPLPSRPVLLSDYPYLPDNEDTDTRYVKLRRRIKNTSNGGNGSGSRPGRQGSATGGQSQKGTGGPGGPSSRAPSMNGIPTVDDHVTWGEIVKDAAQAKATIRMDVATAWGNLTAKEKDKVTEPFASIAMEAAQEEGLSEGLGIGVDAGTGASSLKDGNAKVPWQIVLRRYVGKLMERRPVFGRPPRRFPELAGVIPGQGRFVKKPKVMAVIDTSGSMTEEMLADISAELGIMARHYDVLVVECDEAIHAVYPYKPIKAVHGRGGTDFRPPLAPPFLKKHRPDLVVYFTDGFGSAPGKSPAVPIIWCITEDGKRPVGWGREVKLKQS